LISAAALNPHQTPRNLSNQPDTMGITPLLRRRTAFVIACVAHATPLGPGVDAPTFAAKQYDVGLGGLFLLAAFQLSW
jgi:hypothetical protein